MRVRRIDGLHGSKHAFKRMIGLHRLHRKGDILRRNWLAVMERGSVHQLQRDGQAVIGDVPALSQVGMRLPFVIKAQRRGKDLRAREPRQRVSEAGLDVCCIHTPPVVT